MDDANKQLNVLVLGGNGFIGRQVVASLSARAQVTIGTRQTNVRGNSLSIKMHNMLNVDDWLKLLQNFDIVVNCVGILREREGESYEAVHTKAVSALAQACAFLEVSLIHVSAIGLSANAGSRFIRSKFAGEHAILSSGAAATIVRPSLLDGEGGYGAKWFRRVASWPVQLVMQSQGLVAPLQVTDLGIAIGQLCMMPATVRPKIIELGGMEVYSIAQYLMQLRKAQGRFFALQIAMPKFVVRIVSHMFDVLAWTPLSFGHYELMQGYNVPQNNLLPDFLGRQPTALGVDLGYELNLGAIKPECVVL